MFHLCLRSRAVGDYFRFCVPSPGEKWVTGDLGQELDDFSNAREMLADLYEDRPLIDHAIPFANTIAGDIIVWDTRAMTQDPLEYAIVLLPRDSYQPIPIADTFASFVTEICLTGKFFDVIDSEPFMPPKTYTVFGKQ